MGISDHKITRMLADYRKGDKEALEELLPAVYDHLHRLAEIYMRREKSGHTLQPTALVKLPASFGGRAANPLPADVDWRRRIYPSPEPRTGSLFQSASRGGRLNNGDAVARRLLNPLAGCGTR